MPVKGIQRRIYVKRVMIDILSLPSVSLSRQDATRKGERDIFIFNIDFAFPFLCRVQLKLGIEFLWELFCKEIENYKRDR